MIDRRTPGWGLTVGLTLLVGSATAWSGQTEIDAFMEQVLARRDENRITLRQYVLDERETAEVVGPVGLTLQSFDREYSWYVRDGFLVRSPTRFDGVVIDETERRVFEDNWLREERRRARRPPRDTRRPSRRSAYDNVRRTVQREWGRSVSDDLGRRLTDDARRRGDGHAAIVAGVEEILEDLGGLDAVGLDLAVRRTRDAFVMLADARLEDAEVVDLLSGLVPRFVEALESASPGDPRGVVELVELAVEFQLDLSPLTTSVEELQTVLASRGLTAEVTVVEALRRAASAPGRDMAPQGRSAGRAPSSLQPRFVSEAYFLDFEFEPGHYYFVGREALEGRDVVKIEYYPQQMFSAADATIESEEREDRIEAGFDKTSLVTLWIDPEEHQIVKFTFDNVGFDFLPMRWLVRLDDLTASMVMAPFLDGVWLPQTLEFRGALTLATGTIAVRYSRRFSNYRAADVRARIIP